MNSRGISLTLSLPRILHLLRCTKMFVKLIASDTPFKLRAKIINMGQTFHLLKNKGKGVDLLRETPYSYSQSAAQCIRLIPLRWFLIDEAFTSPKPI